MIPESVLSLDEIDLSDLEFWERPWAEREGAFALLRRERPLAFFEEPDAHRDLAAGPTPRARVPGRDPSRRRHRDQPAPRDLLLGPGGGQHLRPSRRDGGVLRRHDLDRQSRATPGSAGSCRPRSTPGGSRASRRASKRWPTGSSTGPPASGECDFVTEIAAPFPLEIICDMMGVPPSEYATVFRVLQRHPERRRPRVHPRGDRSGAGLHQRRPGAHRPDERAQRPPGRPPRPTT